MCKHQVLPRDTLRMSSKTVLWSDVGGREKADYYIRGGEHFLRTLYYLVGLGLTRGFFRQLTAFYELSSSASFRCLLEKLTHVNSVVTRTC